MPKVYTEEEIRNLVLTQINSIRKLSDLGISFNVNDSIEAFDTAVRECGFTVPTANDEDIDIKNEWLINRQRRWYYHSIRERLLLLVESGDINSGGLIDRISKIIAEMDEAFRKAMESEMTSHLFLHSVNIINSSEAIPTGFVNDRAGQDLTKYES